MTQRRSEHNPGERPEPAGFRSVSTLVFVLNVPLVIVPDGELPDVADVLVDATIADRPYRLHLDTAAARTKLVTDSYLAALPVSGQHSSGGVFGQRQSGDIVAIPGLIAGDLATGPFQVVRASATGGDQHLLGMDVLTQYCCRFRFDARMLELTDSPAAEADLDLQIDSGNHVYIDLSFDGITARACWDSAAGISVVDQAFANSHPELFTRAGNAAGTDSAGTQASAPLLAMTGPSIAGVEFAPSTVAVIDLGPVNQAAEIPLSVVLGAIAVWAAKAASATK